MLTSFELEKGRSTSNYYNLSSISSESRESYYHFVHNPIHGVSWLWHLRVIVIVACPIAPINR